MSFDGERSGNGYENIHTEMGRVRMERYHVRLGKRRTTVTVDTIVSGYLALHLRFEPGSMQAHSAERSWLQERLDESNDPGCFYVSQWLLGQAVEAVARPSLVEAYGRWVDTKYPEREERGVGDCVARTIPVHAATCVCKGN